MWEGKVHMDIYIYAMSDFPMVNFLYLGIDMPESPAYCVWISP